MVKLTPCRFEQCLSAFTMLLVEGYYETALLDVYLPMYLRVRSFGNTLPMTVIFV